MHDLRIGKIRYYLSGSDHEIALTHALGSTFVELQQLEFTLISSLVNLAENVESTEDASFDVFASKTFGNLIRAMAQHDFLTSLAKQMLSVKEKRDFFVHKFLFHRYGEEFTTDAEYTELIAEATSLGGLFAEARAKFHDFMLQNAPLVILAIKRDSNSGEFIIVESEFSKKGNS
jgi:hypothetical protein